MSMIFMLCLKMMFYPNFSSANFKITRKTVSIPGFRLNCPNFCSFCINWKEKELSSFKRYRLYTWIINMNGKDEEEEMHCLSLVLCSEVCEGHSHESVYSDDRICLPVAPAMTVFFTSKLRFFFTPYQIHMSFQIKLFEFFHQCWTQATFQVYFFK